MAFFIDNMKICMRQASKLIEITGRDYDTALRVESRQLKIFNLHYNHSSYSQHGHYNLVFTRITMNMIHSKILASAWNKTDRRTENKNPYQFRT